MKEKLKTLKAIAQIIKICKNTNAWYTLEKEHKPNLKKITLTISYKLD